MPLTIARRRRRLPRDVENEQHRPAAKRRDVGARPGLARFARNAVEEAHEPLANHELGFGPGLRRKRAKQAFGHRPAVEIDAGAPASRRVKSGIDVIGAAFRAGDRDAAARERAHEAKRQRGLAGARTRRRDDEARADHARSRGVDAGAASASKVMAKGASAWRNLTIAPIATIAGAARPSALASALAVASFVTSTRWRFVVASLTIASGRVGAHAAGDQRFGDAFEIAHRHVEDERRAGRGERREIGRALRPFGEVACREDERVIRLARRRRDACISEPADAGRDARNDAKLHAGLGERARFLGAAPEDEGIAALEAQHLLAEPRELDQPQADVALAGRRLAAALAREFKRHLAAPRARALRCETSAS